MPVAPGHNHTDEKLRSLVERIERLECEKKLLSEDIKELFIEAKSAGYKVPQLRALIRERKKDPDDVAEFQTLLSVYRNALGGFAELPLGAAALKSVGG